MIQEFENASKEDRLKMAYECIDLTFAYLTENGVDENDAVNTILNIISYTIGVDRELNKEECELSRP
ncbi:MAG: hypothetical protein K5694_03070 [Bacilli bacterium]|nr:hypothetical protein [Bacilli bacterium]